MLNLRIVYVDHYLSKPILNLDPLKSKLNNEDIKLLPIIRIFGTTSKGDKCCAHIHGFFPYLSIERDSFSEYSIECLGNELNKILNDVYQKPNNYYNQHNANQNNELERKDTNKIYNIEIIKSKSFYGFRENNQQFLRIYFLNPKSVKLAFKLIKQGKLFNRKCNIYEAHITYIMQFFVNFKLSGMNFINLINYNERNHRDRRLLSKDKLYFMRQEKQTICKIEIDVQPHNIVVTKSENKFINPGLVLIWQEEKRRLIESNKDIKGIFKSNLKDCGNRIYEKKSLELNYIQQLNDYLNFKDNFNLFNNQFNSLVNHSLNNQSLSQSVLERIIQNEKELVNLEQSKQISKLNRFDEQSKLLNSNDIHSQKFTYLIKNFKNFKNQDNIKTILDSVREEDEEENSSCDELDLDNEAKFTSLMLQTQKSILNSQTNDLEIKNSQKQSQNSNDDSSLVIDPNEFNLNGESIIRTPKSRETNSEFSLNSENNSQSDGSNISSFKDNSNLKRSLNFDDDDLDQFNTGCLVSKLTSLNEEPLFSDDDDYLFRNSDDEAFTELNTQNSQKLSSSPSQSSQKSNSTLKAFSQKSQFSDIDPLLSQQPPADSQGEIFSFYSLNSITGSSQLAQTSHQIPPSSLENKNIQIDNSTSTPVNFSNSNNKINKHRIRTCLGTKFLKLSTHDNQSPSSSNYRLNDNQSPNLSLNRSTQSTQSTKFTESSFTMNEKIQHLSESDIDFGSPMSNLSHENQNLTLLTMELFATTENGLKPNPLNDSIKMIFYMIYNDYTNDLIDNRSKKKHFIGIIIQEAKNDILKDLNETVKSELSSNNSTFCSFNQTTHTKCKPKSVNNFLYFKSDEDIKVDYVENELSLIEKFIEILVEHDPDVLTGYEIETSSWGYLITRAEILRIDISTAFSRLLIDFNQQQKKSTEFSTKTNNLKDTFLNRTQCEEDDDQLDIVSSDDDDDIEKDNIINPQLINNNYLNRNKWEQLEKFKQNRCDFGTIKTRSDLRDKVKDNDDLIRQFQTVFTLSWVSPCYMSLIGRIMLNLWRCIRKELALNSYTFENVYYHLFKKRIPYFVCKQLTDWYYSDNNFLRQNVLNYYLIRIKGNIEIIDKLGLINTTSELARVFGIQFSDVISKGSQFRVESLLYRSTIESDFSYDNDQNIQLTPEPIKTNFNKSIKNEINLNRSINKLSNKSSSSSVNQQKRNQRFMLLSCNFEDRLKQMDPIIIPFIMEPKAAFYTNNVAVLDFQSLYPSIMIAYNYCYSTCLGKLDFITNNLDEFPFGFSKLKISTEFIKNNADSLNISPNGILFCNQNIRKGILSSILEEILDTRLMVKKCLKMYNDENEKKIAKLLDARQLGLKLLSNVTYGYTAAGFSGRMPCIDLADAIISKGRETLINSINFINNKKDEFGGEVIYGDTDSMFVEFKNTTREEAFERAEKLCELITLSNPNPIKLKLEKVYSECVLLTKKRYAGFAYDSPDQKEPRFETKGIETIRRDTINLVKKVMEKSLRILFEKKSISEIRPYLERIFMRVIHDENGDNLTDYIFAKEYKGILGYKPRTHLPSQEISDRIAQRYGEHCRPFIKERVPYIIANNEIDDKLTKLVFHPLDFFDNKKLRINSKYYLDRVLIPPIQRVFGLLNLNIRRLYIDLPKKVFYLNTIEKQNFNLLNTTISSALVATTSTSANTLTNYFNFVKCLICDRKIDQTSNFNKSICLECLNNNQTSVINLFEKCRLNEIKLTKSTNQCLDCTKMNCIQTECRSIDCENLFQQSYLSNEYKLMKSNYETILNELSIDKMKKNLKSI